jgi:uncharacterized membrane protein YtjA (UPF0391 family)
VFTILRLDQVSFHSSDFRFRRYAVSVGSPLSFDTYWISTSVIDFSLFLQTAHLPVPNSLAIPDTISSVLRWAILFLILAVIMGFLGFVGVVAAILGTVAVVIAKLLFKLFLFFFIAGLLVHLFRGRRSV